MSGKSGKDAKNKALLEAASFLASDAEQAGILSKKSYPSRTQFQMFTPSMKTDANLWSSDNDFSYLNSLLYDHPLDRYSLNCPVCYQRVSTCSDPGQSYQPCRYSCCKCDGKYTMADIIMYNMFFIQDKFYPEIPCLFNCPKGCTRDGNDMTVLLKRGCEFALLCRLCIGTWSLKCQESIDLFTAHNYMFESIKGLHFQIVQSIAEVADFRCYDCLNKMGAKVDTIPSQHKGFRAWENCVVYYECPNCGITVNQREICHIPDLYRTVRKIWDAFYCPCCANVLELASHSNFVHNCEHCKMHFTTGHIMAWLPNFVNRIDPANISLKFIREFKEVKDAAEVLLAQSRFEPITDVRVKLCMVPHFWENDDPCSPSKDVYNIDNIHSCRVAIPAPSKGETRSFRAYTPGQGTPRPPHTHSTTLGETYRMLRSLNRTLPRIALPRETRLRVPGLGMCENVTNELDTNLSLLSEFGVVVGTKSQN